MAANDRLRLGKRFAACFTDHRGPNAGSGTGRGDGSLAVVRPGPGLRDSARRAIEAASRNIVSRMRPARLSDPAFFFSDEVRRRACGASHERNRLAPLHPEL